MRIRFILSLLITLFLVTTIFAQTDKNANTVTLAVNFFNKQAEPLDNVSKEEITINRKGKGQNIISLVREEKPLIYCLTVDDSRSFKSLLPVIKQAAIQIFDGNKSNDETAIARFAASDDITILQEFTSNKRLLEQGMNGLTSPMGQTALFDAIYLSVEKTAGYVPEKTGVRRAVLVITDGEDRSSFYKEEDILKLLRKSDVQVFFIGITELLSNQGGFIGKSPVEKATSIMNRIARKSGGVVFYPKNINELAELSKKIPSMIRNQYSLTYTHSSEVQKKDCYEPEIEFVKGSNREEIKVTAKEVCIEKVK